MSTNPALLGNSNAALIDSFGRRLSYLRLSITEACNFRCQYCLPDGYQFSGDKPHFLTLDEIRRVATAFAALGMRKIRLTGGEPTLRKDFTEIARVISSVPNIKERVFTTNGYKLFKHAQEWREAGLTGLNVSIDSLRPEVFHTVTGHDKLKEVLRGVDSALHLGFEKVKINAVLLKGVNDSDLELFLNWIKHTPVSIRFIELMQTGDNLDYFKKHHLSADIFKSRLRQEGWSEQARQADAGPAIVLTHPDYQGSIGLIAPYSKDFCNTCNRLRVTSVGDLRLCLFSDKGPPLRHLLQSDEQQSLLMQRITELLDHKKATHFLAFGNTGITPHLASVGG